jgi:hypothetical protein
MSGPEAPKAGGGQERFNEQVRAVQEAQSIVRIEMDGVLAGQTKDEVKQGYRRIMIALHTDTVDRSWPVDPELREMAQELFKCFSVVHAQIGKHFSDSLVQEELDRLSDAKAKFLAWKPKPFQPKPATPAPKAQPKSAAAPRSNPKPAPTPEPNQPKASWRGGPKPEWKNGVPFSGAAGAKTEAPKPNPPRAETPPVSPPPPKTKPPEPPPVAPPPEAKKAPETPPPQPPREPPPRRSDGAERMTDWGREKKEGAAEQKNQRAEEQRVYKAIQERLTLIEGAIEEVEDNMRRSSPAKRPGFEKDLAGFRAQQKECLYRLNLLRGVFDLRKRMAEYTTTIRQGSEFLAQAAQYAGTDADWLSRQAQVRANVQVAQLFVARVNLDLARDEPLVASVVKNWQD